MSSSNIYDLRGLLLAVAFLSHTLHVLAFSLAVPVDPITEVAFPVVWQRDSIDPTVFSLDRQWKSPSTNEFTGGGIFAEINGTLGDSLDPQTASLVVTESGTFIMYALVTNSDNTTTFFESSTFTVLSPSQAANTDLQTTGTIYLGTSFPATPSSSSTSSISVSTPTVVSTAGVTSTTLALSTSSSTAGSSSHSLNTAVVAGSVVGGVVAVALIAAFAFLLYRRRSKNVADQPAHAVPHPMIFSFLEPVPRRTSWNLKGRATPGALHPTPTGSSFDLNRSIQQNGAATPVSDMVEAPPPSYDHQ